MQCIQSYFQMFRIINLFLLSVAISTPPSYGKTITSKNKPVYAAIVVDYESGKILYQQNAAAITPPASLTKIMSLLMLFDALEQGKIRLTDMIPVSKHAASQAPGKLGLRPGAYISIQNVILAMVTKSANDAATAAGEFLGGTECAFAEYMTQRARQFGMMNTTFKNASGLPAVGQLTTARDMAILGLITLKHYKKYFHLFGVKEFCYNNVCHINHNYRLLSQKQLKFDGIKTGFVNASGFNVIASHQDNQGKRLVVVVMGGPTPAWRDKRVVEIVQRLKSFPAYRYAEKKPLPSHDHVQANLVSSKINNEINLPVSSDIPTSIQSSSSQYSLLLGYYGSQLRAETISKQALLHAKLDKNHPTSVKRVRVSGRYLYQASIDNLSKEQADLASKALKYFNVDSSIVEQSS